jgi:hypothetical protein
MDKLLAIRVENVLRISMEIIQTMESLYLLHVYGLCSWYYNISSYYIILYYDNILS